MKLKELRNKRWFKILSNKYVLLGLIFAINSWFIHHELNQEINELRENKEYYQKEISHDKAIIGTLGDSIELEKFARQKYYMKRPNEEIYIIEYDTVD